MRLILLLTTSLLIVAAPDSSAQLDPARRPVPLRRPSLPAFVPSEDPPPPVLRALPGAYATAAPSWQRFDRASRCEQGDGVLRCDNGYREETAR